MKPYEAIIIINSAVPEDKIDAAVAKYEKKIRESGASEISISKWGMKKLAYPVKKAKNASDGYYVLINFSGEGKVPNDLRSLLNVSEEVIRYSIVCSKPPEEEAKEEAVEIEPSMILQPASPAESPRLDESGGQGEIS